MNRRSFLAAAVASIAAPALRPKSTLFDTGVLSSTATLPTLKPASIGGNGVKLLCILNGISNGPVLQ